MSLRNLAILIVVMAVPLSLWIVMNEAKNDVRALTATVARQVKKGDEEMFHRFFSKYRMPDEDPFEQETMFTGAWKALKDVLPDEVVYGDRKPVKLADGHDHQHRQVVLDGKDGAGNPLTVKLEWVLVQGKWYILGYSRE